MVWRTVARADTIGDSDVVGIDVDGAPIALYRLGDDIFATDGMCTHALGLLADGWVEDGEIECPLHQARFDIRTGLATCRPATQAVAVYPVRIVGKDILVKVPATP